MNAYGTCFLRDIFLRSQTASRAWITFFP